MKHNRPTPGGAFNRIGAQVQALDVAVFRALAAFTLPKWLTLSLVLLVRIGDGYLWGMIALGLWAALPLAEVKTIVLHCLVAITISLCIYFPIKFSLRRLRPYDSGMDVKPLVPPLDKYSFPSGHTMNNLAVALTLAHQLPGLLAPAILLPVFLGLLRIQFGVHYLSDIVGGSLLGAAAFFLGNLFFPFPTP
jgi:undecaprenyl-diphosphatase